MQELCTIELSAEEFRGAEPGSSSTNFECFFEHNLRPCVAQEKARPEIASAAVAPALSAPGRARAATQSALTVVGSKLETSTGAVFWSQSQALKLWRVQAIRAPAEIKL